MLFLIYGEDDFRSENYLKEVISFYNKKGVFFISYDFREEEDKKLTLNELRNVLSSKPLFSSVRLILFKDILTNFNEEFLEQILETLKKEKIKEAKDILVIFYERGNLEKNRLSQWLSKNSSKVKSFELLKNRELENYLIKEEEKFKIELSKEVREIIILSFGSNTREISKVFQKLSLFKKTYFDRNFVEQNISLPVKTNIFRFLDSLAARKTKEAFKLLKEEIDSGTHPLVILTMIVNQFRNLIKIKTYLESPKKISFESLKIHPFVYKKLLKVEKSFSLDGLKKTYLKLLNYDKKIKEGTLEPVLGIELLLLDLRKIK
ncbi:MAG TPA: DNA polymerase III subunit delta [Candidatus Paceibacterota bacterium]|nr:DNA polymerase III subunit delta [Candidatus Paceibacterota bacterium]